MNESRAGEMKGKVDLEWNDGIYVNNFHFFDLS